MLWFNPYLAERLAEERRKDAMREAEQAWLIRAAKDPKKEQGSRRSVMLNLKSLQAIFADRRVDEPRRQSPSTAPSPTWERCSGS